LRRATFKSISVVTTPFEQMLVFKEYNKIRYEYGNKILLTLESEQDFSEKGVVTTDTLGGTQYVTF
jgi:hypothetical protein